MFWLIALAVAIVLAALVWWTSGRARRGIDSTKVRRVGDDGNRNAANYDHPPGGNF